MIDANRSASSIGYRKSKSLSAMIQGLLPVNKKVNEILGSKLFAGCSRDLC
jgi:hypothetical protein